MKLLLVEDKYKLAGALANILKKNGYSVALASDGPSGIEMAATGFYDIIILDRMLPALSGIDLLKEFRQLGFDTPVLILTAKDSPNDRVEGLDAGADDYVVKPFSTEELMARLRALTRDNAIRHTPAAGKIAVDLSQAGQKITLTVADSGEGIQAAQLDKIFDRFYQADKARSHGGAGLGLAIAKWIVESHNGFISVTSSPGNRTVFTVQLTSADGSAQAPLT